MPGTRRALAPDAERAANAAIARERLRTELRDAVAELRSQHHFRAWLCACAALPRYSPTNVMLIAAPARRRGLESSAAASVPTWARLGYRVREGERGLMIRRPVKVRDHNRDPDERVPAHERRLVNFRPAMSSAVPRSNRTQVAGSFRSSSPTRRSPAARPSRARAPRALAHRGRLDHHPRSAAARHRRPLQPRPPRDRHRQRARVRRPAARPRPRGRTRPRASSPRPTAAPARSASSRPPRSSSAPASAST
jgi:hypothetical protein